MRSVEVESFLAAVRRVDEVGAGRTLTRWVQPGSGRFSDLPAEDFLNMIHMAEEMAEQAECTAVASSRLVSPPVSPLASVPPLPPVLLTDDVSLALVSRLGSEVVGDSSDDDLLDGLDACQRAVGLVTSWMVARIVELHARRVGPAQARVAAAQAFGTAHDLSLAVQAETIAEGSVGDEVACALSWSRTRADRQISIGLMLSNRLPRTLDAVAAGRLEVKKAEVIATDLAEITNDDVVTGVEDLVLVKAAGWNVPVLREEIRKAILTVAPLVAAERAEKARARREVRLYPEPDEMMRLDAIMSADQGVRVMSALDVGAAALKAAGDERTADQVRVDLIVEGTELAAQAALDALDETGADPVGQDAAADIADLDVDPNPGLSTGSGPSTGARAGTAGPRSSTAGAGRSQPGTPRPGVLRREQKKRVSRVRRLLRQEVNVTVPLETLTGDTEHPGYLARYGPITAVLARRMATEVARTGWWRCVVTDDVHGTLLGMGRTTHADSYQAPIALQRFLNLRDRTCDFPGCRQNAATCEFDHQIPHPAGATCECNGRKRCKHHHRVKHETGWQVTDSSDPDDPPGTVIWTSPTGRTYPSTPPAIGIPHQTDKAPSTAATGSSVPLSGRQPESWTYDPAAGLPELHLPDEDPDLNAPPF